MSSKLLTVFGGAIPWLLNAAFTSDDAAPVSSPHRCVPGPGLLAVTDTGDNVSIGGGVMTITGGVTAWTDPRIVGTDNAGNGFPRAAGLAFGFSIKKDSVDVGDDAVVGWRSSSSGGSASVAHGLYSYRNNEKYSLGSDEYWIYPSASVVADTWYSYVIVLRAVGCHVLKHAGGNTYDRVYVANSGEAATLWPSVQQGTGLATGTYDNLVVRQLPAPWTSDSDLAAVSNATAGAFVHPSDFVLDWTPGGVSRHVILRQVDANNYLKLDIDGSGTLALVKVVSGSSTTIKSWVGSMTGAERVLLFMWGEYFYTLVDNTARLTYIAGIPFTTATAGTLSADATSFVIWRRSETLPFDVAPSGADPETKVWLADGITVDASDQITAWVNGGTIGDPTLRAASAFAKAYDDVAWLGTNPGVQFNATIRQPWTLYMLICRNNRPGAAALGDPRWMLRNGALECTFPPDDGDPVTVQGASFAGIAIDTETWQRVRLHANDKASFAQVEGVRGAPSESSATTLSGAIQLFSYGQTDGGGVHAWVPYCRLVEGDVDADYHNAIWAEMDALGSEHAFWESELITADNAHNGFPGYCHLADGTELMVYRKGSDHAASLDGVIVLRTRADAESEWGAETTILDQTGEATPYDSRDPSLMVTSTGRVLCTGFSYDGAADDAWCIYSDDGGATWSAKVAMGHPWSAIACSAPAVEVSGNIYQPVYSGDNPQDIGLCVSADNGSTWAAGAFVAVADGVVGEYDLQEPSLIMVDGEWCVLARGDDRSTRLFTSPDGSAWTNRGVVFASQSRHALVTLTGGDVVAIYRGARSAFTDLRCRRSADALRTWSDEVCIKPHHVGTEYAAAVLRSGVVCVVASLKAGTIGADIHYFERNEDDL